MYLNIQTPMFDWCVVSCASKDVHPQETCSKKTGLCAQNMLTIIWSIVSIIGCGEGVTETVWPFNEHDNLCFENE